MRIWYVGAIGNVTETSLFVVFPDESRLCAVPLMRIPSSATVCRSFPGGVVRGDPYVLGFGHPSDARPAPTAKSTSARVRSPIGPPPAARLDEPRPAPPP